MEHKSEQPERQIQETLEHIAQALRSAGYDPYAQMIGYIKTGDASYITRKDGARALIQDIPPKSIEQFAATLSGKNR